MDPNADTVHTTASATLHPHLQAASTQRYGLEIQQKAAGLSAQRLNEPSKRNSTSLSRNYFKPKGFWTLLAYTMKCGKMNRIALISSRLHVMGHIYIFSLCIGTVPAEA